tara:strand:+ start:1270 stop:1650 length:381 start_codon:yes stop_codon:yes gene_type:complete
MGGTEDTCDICTENMEGRGRVTLKCGHYMCPSCFAEHARVNNTCPYCRDEFASKIKRNERVPLEMVESIIVSHIISDTDFYRGINRRINWEIESSRQVAILKVMVSNMCHLAMNFLTNWYEDVIPP